MEYLIALALSAVAGWLLRTVGARAIDGAIGAFAALVAGWPSDPWPRGVQEEDRDRPWGAAARELARQPALVVVEPMTFIEPSASAVPTADVRVKTRLR